MNLQTLLAAGVLTLAAVTPAHADDHGPRVPLLPAYQQECGSCHVAYPPGFLPAGSWRRLLGGLDRHFGTDASLDPTMTAALTAWLGAHAGSGKRAREEPPQDRISRARWFQREHDEIAAATWARPAIKSPSNCAACHTQADQGDFSERRIRIPR